MRTEKKLALRSIMFMIDRLREEYCNLLDSCRATDEDVDACVKQVLQLSKAYSEILRGSKHD